MYIILSLLSAKIKAELKLCVTPGHHPKVQSIS